MQNATIITAVVLAIIVPIAIKWIQYRFPVPPSDIQLDLNALNAEFGMRWHVAGILLGTVSFAGLTWAIGMLLAHLGQPCGVVAASDGTLTMRTPRGFYFIPAGFLALGICGPLALLTLQTLLGERYPRWRAYANMKAKYNTSKVLPFAVAVLILIAAAMLYPMHNNRFELGARGFESCMFEEESYPYENIVAIYDVAGFKELDQPIREQPHYIVELVDKTYWSSEWVMGFFHDQHRYIIERIAERSGKSIQALTFYQAESGENSD